MLFVIPPFYISILFTSSDTASCWLFIGLNFQYSLIVKCYCAGILGGPDSGSIEDDQVILDLNSNLGIFLRHCVLAFNLLSFEVCHYLCQ